MGLEDFLQHVEKKDNGCWEWQGSLNGAGYGLYWRQGERYAHRHSFKLHKGPIPPGMLVRHRCDNKRCVNPDHLILGTRRDNAMDAMDRGRLARGSRRRPDITDEMVFKARCDYHEGRRSGRDIAEAFGMFPSQISDIMWGRLWRHVRMPTGVPKRPRRRKLKHDTRKEV